MFLLATQTIQFLIIGGVLILFIGSFILNKRTKAPQGIEIPEKCHSCLSSSCIVKRDIEKVKDELREVVDHCEVNDEKK
jgi:hypothetical protein